MGLTNRSVGKAVTENEHIHRRTPSDFVIALAGNPNVGKSTLFNSLTGMHQHTGNWPGKTVTYAQGYCKEGENGFVLVDLPGAYSLLTHSAEEDVTRDFLASDQADAVVVVCDATCPERNLNLVLQVLECTSRVVVCFNLMDEAKRKHVHTDLLLIQERLGVPVVSTVARKKKSVARLKQVILAVCQKSPTLPCTRFLPEPIEDAAQRIGKVLQERFPLCPNTKWLRLRLLEGTLTDEAIRAVAPTVELGDPVLTEALNAEREHLSKEGVTWQDLTDGIASAYVLRAQEICRDAVVYGDEQYSRFDRRMDRLLTGKRTAYPIMLALLALIFFLTITLANYPSAYLAAAFDFLIGKISSFLLFLGAPPLLHDILIDGVLGVLAQVVSVMLPPMAIFFPLFTLLEDAGYLPRIAYNLDRPFHACNACGKQALTMCMGFGCNAAGVVGCRIIDSPRERLLAILTNSFVPCNGRFPALIAILSMFFVVSAGGITAGLASALLLTALILLGIFATFAVTKLLSHTLLRGLPSSFALELPPYRPPQILRVLIRSVFDRTLFVLARAAAVAAPAGLLIWCMANLTVGDATVLAHCAAFLDPLGRLLGMDGIILMAFILGFPANEIVIPIILMAYQNAGTPIELETLADTKALLVANGWTPLTALCVLIFFLFHWPCSTTLLTVKKETGSWRWTLFAALLPTVIGLLLCLVIASAAKFIF